MFLFFFTEHLLGFCELVEDEKPGERVFDIKLQGETILRKISIAHEAGGPYKPFIKTIQHVAASDWMEIEIVPKTGGEIERAMLCAVEVVEE